MEKGKNKIEKNKLNFKNKLEKVFSAKLINSNSKKEKNYLKEKRNALTAKNNNKNKRLFRPSTTIFSTNINTYRYLFDNNNKETINNSNWVINLRLFDNSKKKKIKGLGEPSFYLEDLNKFIKKKKSKLKKSKSVYDFEKFPDFSKYRHLLKRNDNNHGTILNRFLLYYKLNLRKSNDKIMKKWNSNININENNYSYSLVDLPKSKLNEKINDKYILRPYKIEYKKDEYNGDKILKKKYIKDKVKAYNILGQNSSLPPYNDKYIDKNCNEINELLGSRDRSQAKTWYQIRLRRYNINKNGENDKIQQNKKKWKNW